ncbi:MAG: phage baseplate assembly protein V [Bacteroidales bacterium]
MDNNDPTFSGRCKVKVYGIFDKTPNEYLPWATPTTSAVFGSNGAGSISVPKIGIIVRVNFCGGDIYSPEYTCIQNLDTSLSERLSTDYIGAHVLLYDTDNELSVIFQKQVGFEMFYKGSYVNISPESMITIAHANGDSVIQLQGGTINIASKDDIKITTNALVDIRANEVKLSGSDTTKIGPGPYTPALNSDIIWSLLTKLATNLDNKFPATPGVNTALVKSCVNSGNSTNVLISQ